MISTNTPMYIQFSMSTEQTDLLQHPGDSIQCEEYSSLASAFRTLAINTKHCILNNYHVSFFTCISDPTAVQKQLHFSDDFCIASADHCQKNNSFLRKIDR